MQANRPNLFGQSPAMTAVRNGVIVGGGRQQLHGALPQTPAYTWSSEMFLREALQTGG